MARYLLTMRHLNNSLTPVFLLFAAITSAYGSHYSVGAKVGMSGSTFWDSITHSFRVPDGKFDIFIGSSSADLRLETVITASSNGPNPAYFTKRWKAPDCRKINHRFYHIAYDSDDSYSIDIFRLNGTIAYSSEQKGPSDFIWHETIPGLYFMRINFSRSSRIIKRIVVR